LLGLFVSYDTNNLILDVDGVLSREKHYAQEEAKATTGRFSLEEPYDLNR